MFASKPSTARQEFEELHELLGTAVVAEVLGKRPESVSRLRKRGRYTRPLERLIDDVWSVVFVARRQARWRDDQVRAFLLLRQPQLDLRPAAELIRAGQTQVVLDAIVATHPDSDHVAPPARVGDVAARRRPAGEPQARAAAQRRLAQRGLAGLDRQRLIAAGHEAWGTEPGEA